jgi:succinoglycan biosynthesis transport protein ExoP
MSILQFMRILWGRRILILCATVSCVIGGFVATRVFPPRWPGSARVMLNTIKPDPVTGLMIGNGARAYVATQIELITDYSVAGQVADELGWMSDPGWIAAYQSRSKSDKRDFRHWISQQVTDRTKAELVEGSNILEITYQGNSAEQARAGADALRTAYMNRSLEMRRDEASRNAEWYDGQSAKVQAQLLDAENRKAQFESQNGVVLDDKEVDLDSQRLAVLAQAGAGFEAASVAPSAAGPSPSAASLAEVDAQIAQASRNLGPNHPELQALRNRRAALAALVGQEQKALQQAQEGAAASAARAGASAVDRAIEAQKARVLAQHDKIARLHQLQNEVDRLRDLYNRTAQRAADFRQEAAASIDNVTPLGGAGTPKAPSFPNMALIMGGALGLGLGLGGLLAVLCELFARRVRSVEDLEASLGVPVLAVIAGPSKRLASGQSRPWAPQIRTFSRRKVVQA